MTTLVFNSPSINDRRWNAFSLFAVCTLAVSVSLGAALVGISKVLILLAVPGRLRLDGWAGVKAWIRQAPAPVWIIAAALLWFALSGFWTIANADEARTAFFRHARLIWLVAVLYLIRSPSQALKVLFWLGLGQAGVVLLSWLMWLGVPIPFATADFPPEMGILFASTLEQPVMSTLLVVLLWCFRGRLQTQWVTTRSALWISAVIALVVANVFLIMTGRTGYLVMLVFGAIAVWHASSSRTRILLLITSLALVVLLIHISPRFHDRVMEVPKEVTLYGQGRVDTSQAIRLEMWRVSIHASVDRPLFGHGVGSYPKLYEKYHGRDPRGASNPHQQYLFWLTEFGLVGLMLLLALFASLARSARHLSADASFALCNTVLVAAVMSLANCPFYGVGMGEFFLLMMATLMALKEDSCADTDIPRKGLA